MMDVEALREQFPITRCSLRVADGDRSLPLAYLDHAASTHPPLPVLEAHRRFLESAYANVHRGRHFLSGLATERFEAARRHVRRFIGATGEDSTLIFAGNTTQALDVAAHVMGPVAGVTLVSPMEHHSNDLPHRARGPVVRCASRPDGTLDLDDLERKLRQNPVKLVAVTGASNVTGFLPDLGRIARAAHARGARILVDGAQLLGHVRIDVRPEGHPEHIDFLAAAGHKAYAPFGAAFLHAPRALCDAAPPWIPGGGTVAWVTADAAFHKPSPDRHEPGTPNVPGVVALSAALEFLETTGMDSIREHERALTAQALEGLAAIDGVRVLGSTGVERMGVVSFTADGVPHERMAGLLDCLAAVAVRDGCFCAQPYVHHLLGLGDTSAFRRRREAGVEDGLPGAARASFGLYNSAEEVDRLVQAVLGISKACAARSAPRPARRRIVAEL